MAFIPGLILSLAFILISNSKHTNEKIYDIGYYDDNYDMMMGVNDLCDDGYNGICYVCDKTEHGTGDCTSHYGHCSNHKEDIAAFGGDATCPKPQRKMICHCNVHEKAAVTSPKKAVTAKVATKETGVKIQVNFRGYPGFHIENGAHCKASGGSGFIVNTQPKQQFRIQGAGEEHNGVYTYLGPAGDKSKQTLIIQKVPKIEGGKSPEMPIHFDKFVDMFLTRGCASAVESKSRRRIGVGGDYKHPKEARCDPDEDIFPCVAISPSTTQLFLKGANWKKGQEPIILDKMQMFEINDAKSSKPRYFGVKTASKRNGIYLYSTPHSVDPTVLRMSIPYNPRGKKPTDRHAKRRNADISIRGLLKIIGKGGGAITKHEGAFPEDLTLAHETKYNKYEYYDEYNDDNDYKDALFAMYSAGFKDGYHSANIPYNRKRNRLLYY